MKKRGITIRLGPLGLSLLAAGITAVGVAAVSFADSGSGDGNSGGSEQTLPAPPGGGPRMLFRDDLSAADRQKLEDFRTCMEDNGAPAPPDPGKIDPSQGPPKPPSAADREKMQKAFEACKSKLPEKLQNGGPPGVGTFQCGPPPPGAQPQQGQSQERGRNQNQSSQSGTQSSGSAA
jgi:hypothetical protein